MKDTKICSVCKITKKNSEFYIRGSQKKLFDRCKSCFNKYCTQRWIQKKIKAIQYKGSKCSDCGISYPQEPYVIFDFHHKNPNNKEFDWTKLRLKSQDKIQFELDKCDLLCSNCHRKKHHFTNVGLGRIELPISH